jgi:hypothetical protein
VKALGRCSATCRRALAVRIEKGEPVAQVETALSPGWHRRMTRAGTGWIPSLGREGVWGRVLQPRTGPRDTHALRHHRPV